MSAFAVCFAAGYNFFLRIDNIPLHASATFSLFIANRFLGCYPLLSVITNAIAGIVVYISTSMLLVLLDYLIILCLAFEEPPYNFPQQKHYFIIQQQSTSIQISPYPHSDLLSSGNVFTKCLLFVLATLIGVKWYQISFNDPVNLVNDSIL